MVNFPTSLLDPIRRSFITDGDAVSVLILSGIKVFGKDILSSGAQQSNTLLLPTVFLAHFVVQKVIYLISEFFWPNQASSDTSRWKWEIGKSLGSSLLSSVGLCIFANLYNPSSLILVRSCFLISLIRMLCSIGYSTEIPNKTLNFLKALGALPNLQERVNQLAALPVIANPQLISSMQQNVSNLQERVTRLAALPVIANPQLISSMQQNVLNLQEQVTRLGKTIGVQERFAHYQAANQGGR